MNKFKFILMTGAAAVLISGCFLAVGQKYQYHTVLSPVNIESTNEVSVGVLDHRPYIVNKGKAPDFVGLLRGGFGNPFNVTTKSGQPFALDVTQSISGSLKQKGFKVSEIEIPFSDTEESALGKITAAGKDKNLLLIIKEWKSDVMKNFNLHYDLTLKVYDNKNTLLGEKNLQGTDALEKTKFSNEKIEEAFVNGFKQKLSELLNDDQIINNIK